MAKMIFAICFALLAVASFGVEGGPTCPAKNGEYPVYIPHPDCTKFWECSNGTPYLFDCPANLHFNPKLNVCDWPQNAGCKGNGGDDGNRSDETASRDSDSSSSESKEENILNIV